MGSPSASECAHLIGEVNALDAPLAAGVACDVPRGPRTGRAQTHRWESPPSTASATALT